MEDKDLHKQFEESFKLNPAKLLKCLTEQKYLLEDEINKLHRLGVIDDNVKASIFKSESAIVVKYFPELFQKNQDE